MNQELGVGVIYLVRHGQASWGQDDYDVLSDLGHDQAAVVGTELRRRLGAPAIVRSGTLRRQRDTASSAGLPAQTDQRWNEYDPTRLLKHYQCQPANALAPSQQELDQVLATWAGDTDQSHESYARFRADISAALGELSAELSSGETAVVFTSGGVIACVVAAALDSGPAGFVACNRVIVNASITKIVVGRSGTNLLSFNEHAHFDDPERARLTYR